MIPNAIISIAYSILHWLISLFSVSSGWSQDAHDAMNGLGGFLGIWTPILPIAPLVTLLTLVFVVETSIFGLKNSKWILSHIPFVGGKGN